MKLNILIWMLIANSILVFASNSFAENIKQEDKLKIVTPETVARLCPYPNCTSNQNITRIPEGTVLQIEGVQTVKSGIMTVKWFKVTFKNQRGWVSVYDTDRQ